MNQADSQLGFIGLGGVGCNLVMNLAEHGFPVLAYDPSPTRLRTLLNQATGRDVRGTEDIGAFVEALPRPRLILMMLPAGVPVDQAIETLGLHQLRAGDILVDCSNSHYADTKLRQLSLEENGIHLVGVGLSGGEKGILRGPSVVAGGAPEAWEQARPAFEAIAAKFQGGPCVLYCGAGPVGHYVQMVHTGIAYGLMLLLAESYDLMKRGLGLTNEEMRAVCLEWNQGGVGSYLLEVTAELLVTVDQKTGQMLVDVIWPVIKEKGAGTWASQEAMELQVPVPSLDAGVGMRDLSIFEADRASASRLLGGPNLKLGGERKAFLGRLRQALEAGMLLVYGQGLELLQEGARNHQFAVNLGQLARVWSGGSVLRSALLQEVAAAYQACPELINLLVDRAVAKRLSNLQADLRAVVGEGVKAGIPLPGFAAAVSYYDMFRSVWMPTNLIQAHRNYFGAHTYERIDARRASGGLSAAALGGSEAMNASGAAERS